MCSVFNVLSDDGVTFCNYDDLVFAKSLDQTVYLPANLLDLQFKIN